MLRHLTHFPNHFLFGPLPINLQDCIPSTLFSASTLMSSSITKIQTSYRSKTADTLLVCDCEGQDDPSRFALEI